MRQAKQDNFRPLPLKPARRSPSERLLIVAGSLVGALGLFALLSLLYIHVLQIQARLHVISEQIEHPLPR